MRGLKARLIFGPDRFAQFFFKPKLERNTDRNGRMGQMTTPVHDEKPEKSAIDVIEHEWRNVLNSCGLQHVQIDRVDDGDRFGLRLLGDPDSIREARAILGTAR